MYASKSNSTELLQAWRCIQLGTKCSVTVMWQFDDSTGFAIKMKFCDALLFCAFGLVFSLFISRFIRMFLQNAYSCAAKEQVFSAFLCKIHVFSTFFTTFMFYRMPFLVSSTFFCVNTKWIDVLVLPIFLISIGLI